MAEAGKVTYCSVLQGSVLGPLLFTVDLIDLFCECDDSNIASYADETTPYVYLENILPVISKLQPLAVRFFK